MDAIVLAGGLGTRLRAVVADVPKPMAPVAGRPFLEILLSSLQRQGVQRVVLSVGYLADRIVSHFGPRFHDVELVYEIEDEPLGTGGALRRALLRCRTPAALVVNGDTFLDLDLATLTAHWQQSHAPILIARAVDDTLRYGRVEIGDGVVRTFLDKGHPGPGLINTGHYVLPSDLLSDSELPERFSFEADFLSKRVPRLRMDVIVAEGRFIDIGVPDDYRAAQTMLAELAP